jgi:hypothetical protein
MSMRGLAVALLCGVLGIGLGVVVAHAAQPGVTTVSDAHPVTAVSPSVPIDKASHSPFAPDITYPTLEPGLPMSSVHTLTNDLARWTYHVPQGWQAYWVCSTPASCPPGAYLDKPMAPGAVDHAQEVRFRPVGEPVAGGYSLRVRILDNTLNDVHQTVATKIVGFEDSSEVVDFHIIHRDDRSVYFAYRDDPSNYHRFNFFQWFAIPGAANATLEMSVSGRKRDVAGLRALFDRFADNVTGSSPPPPKGGSQQ